MRYWRKVSLLLVVIAAAGWSQRVTTGDEMFAQFRKIGDHLECQCGCSSTISHCNMLNCHFREKVKPEIFAGIKADLPAEEIIERVVAKFGSELRTAPRTEGFGAVGWAMPFVALLLGLVVAPVFVHRWKKQRRETRAPRSLSEDEVARYEARIEKELAELE